MQQRAPELRTQDRPLCCTILRPIGDRNKRTQVRTCSRVKNSYASWCSRTSMGVPS
jgi:hypothetical protein